MNTRLTWEEAKRQANLVKHGLGFADAPWMLASRYRLDVPVMRGGEARMQSFAYVFEVLAVLSLAHVERDERNTHHQFPQGQRGRTGDIP